MQLFAPAKINFYLKILSRRDDGFHEIETLMTPISLYDEITIRPHEPGIRFKCDNPALAGNDNLVVRAAKLFFAKTNREPAIEIVLTKKIPHGAGLGGGSSDAATTLLGLNEMFQAGLSQQELCDLAAQIGSDVSFFIYRSAAVCRGRGEIVTPTKLKTALSLLLLKPEFSVPTHSVYSRWKDSREIPDVSFTAQKFNGIEFVNDLERPVFEKFVFLAQNKTWLQRQHEVGVALMSGSGSTMFAVLKNPGDAGTLASRAIAALDPRLWTYACETLEGAALSAP